MPIDLYNEVKDTIAKEIGVYVLNGEDFYCIKNPIKKKLGTNTDVLIYSLIKSLSREHDKVMKGR